MANAAKTVEARQQWNELAAELRHKADLQDGLITVIPPAGAELEEVPASKGSETEPDGPNHAKPSLSQGDLRSEPEATLSEPAAVSVFKEAPPSEHQPTQSYNATPGEVGTGDPEWEELIAGIRSKTRSNKPD
jgi:hypothetical protein